MENQKERSIFAARKLSTKPHKKDEKVKNLAQMSVVIPVDNVAPYLRECLDSMAQQSLQDIEVICVDDDSTDESPVILEEYSNKDKRFQIITQKNVVQVWRVLQD